MEKIEAEVGATKITGKRQQLDDLLSVLGAMSVAAKIKMQEIPVRFRGVMYHCERAKSGGRIGGIVEFINATPVGRRYDCKAADRIFTFTCHIPNTEDA